MNQIFKDYDEKYVATTIVYADADDGNVFYDSAKKEKIPKDELRNLFLKGMTIDLSGELLAAVAFKDNGADATVTAVHDSAETATPVNFYSAEHGA